MYDARNVNVIVNIQCSTYPHLTAGERGVHILPPHLQVFPFLFPRPSSCCFEWCTFGGKYPSTFLHRSSFSLDDSRHFNILE